MIKKLKQNPGASPDRNVARLSKLSLCGLALLIPALFAQTAFAAESESIDCAAPIEQAPEKRLVIIIDDLGHSLSRGRNALALPGKLTFAVIPHTPFGPRLAEAAHEAGKEVMLHAPMSTVENTPLGAGGLTPELSKAEFLSALVTAIEQVPHVQGINNHMGSDLTQRRLQMAWLMQELRWQDLYFVDSRTSQRTVAARVAQEFNVPHLSRQVFLDNERTVEAIDQQFNELLALVERDGIAVGIGHPYPETIDYLQEALLELHERGITPIYASEALQEQQVELAGVEPVSTMLVSNETRPDC